VSPDSLLIRRLQNVPNFTVVFWLFLIKAVCFFCCILFVRRRQTIRIFKELGVFGWSAGILWGLSLVFFIVAIQNTAVANVLVINASSTVFASIFSYFMLGEVVPLRMFVTSLICFGAIILIFSGGFGLNGIADIVGTCLALGSAVLMGLFFTIIRCISMKNPEDTVEGVMTVYAYNVIAGLVGAIISLGFGPNLVMMTGIDAVYLLVDGIVVCTFSFFMLGCAPFFIPANEVSLYFLIETIVGPLWVYLAGYEAPPKFTLWGGICLIFALALNSILAMREESRELLEVQKDDISQNFSLKSISLESQLRSASMDSQLPTGVSDLENYNRRNSIVMLGTLKKNRASNRSVGSFYSIGSRNSKNSGSFRLSR
jgi:drug/metabolite transporter (DMT)-like permease